MISVADLLTDNRIPGNYFATDAYVRGDLELGLLENRQGGRLIALPEVLIQAIFSGLDKETGQATRLVLLNCGRWWGRNFYSRFSEELTDYYGTALSDMGMAEFLECLQQCWITHGWGKIDLDQTHQQRGFLVVKTWNSPFASHAPKGKLPVCYLETGIFISFFSQLTGKDLSCVQTACESQGADCNLFVLGLEKRLAPVEAMLEAGTGHEAIMQKLCS
ncbi:MAG: V4R domain-containing protein [Leptolyngbyaceae cyanobacterium bins.59]|nr:V4R domain-containing protein [Leptolyngbyaceae cyanobacterium bins.59]